MLRYVLKSFEFTFCVSCIDAFPLYAYIFNTTLTLMGVTLRFLHYIGDNPDALMAMVCLFDTDKR